jgi:hypothetical protein
MADATRGRRGHLALISNDTPPDATQHAQPKQHPQGVWDIPAAAGYRRIAGVDADGNLAIELNMSERIPHAIRAELIHAVRRSLERSIAALKI